MSNDIARGRRQLLVGIVAIVGVFVLPAAFNYAVMSVKPPVGVLGSVLIICVLAFIALRGQVWALRVMSVWAGLVVLAGVLGVINGSRGRMLPSVLAILVLLLSFTGLVVLWRSPEVAEFMGVRRIATGDETALIKGRDG